MTRLQWPDRVETHTIQSLFRAGQRSDLVYDYPGYTYPTESSLTVEDETRIMQTDPRPRVAGGECRWCHRATTVNYRQECVSCWEPRGVPSEEIPSNPPKRDDPLVLENSHPFKPWVEPFSKLPDHYFHPPRPERPAWRIRPWQRYQWQVEDGKHRPNYRSRTAPGRLHPESGTPVWVRCLVCLRTVDKLRHDQVCKPCDDSWKAKGVANGPWGEDYDRWVTWRRTKHAGERAIQHAEEVRSIFPTVTRDPSDLSPCRSDPISIEPINEVAYNGIRQGSESASISLSANV